jgi:predicted transcriptional regulator
MRASVTFGTLNDEQAASLVERATRTGRVSRLLSRTMEQRDGA